jgi:YbbR domain-containing protein
MKNLWQAVRDAAAFFVNLVFPLVRSLRENSGLAVLSVVLAFGVWIVVTDAENPETTRVLEDVDIPVQPINVPGDVAVELIDPETVRVRVRVEESEVEGLTAADFSATIDLQGFPIGDHVLAVDVQALTQVGGLRVEDVIPPEADVSLVERFEAEVEVFIEVVGEPPAGFTMSAPEPEENTVIVEGPQGRVEQVARATAVLDVDGATDDVRQSVRLVPVDSRGQRVTGVSLDPDLVDVRVEVTQETFSQPVFVVPDIIGSPAEGYEILGVEVSPATVTVTGPQADVEALESIATEPIDIGGATSDIARTVSLVAAVNVEPIGDGEVAVTIQIRPKQGSIAIVVPVRAENVAEGLAASGTPPTVEVTLEGDLPRLLELTPSDITATADLSGEEAGGHAVDVEITVADAEVSVAGVAPLSVTITLVES